MHDSNQSIREATAAKTKLGAASHEISRIRQFEVGSITHILSTVQARCPIASCKERDQLCLELYILPRLS
jgi:hypothetical protein